MNRPRIEEQLAALTTLSSAQLRGEWLRLYKMPAPKVTADLLRRGVAWKMQEKALGGFSSPALRQIERLVRGSAGGGAAVRQPPLRIKPGTRLVRDWGGESHHVVVLDKGYLYRERHYGSLSRIASTITGAKWSGPRFFGLTRSAGEAAHA